MTSSFKEYRNGAYNIYTSELAHLLNLPPCILVFLFSTATPLSILQCHTARQRRTQNVSHDSQQGHHYRIFGSAPLVLGQAEVRAVTHVFPPAWTSRIQSSPA